MAAKKDIILAVIIITSVAVFGFMFLFVVLGSFIGEDLDISAGLGERIAVIELRDAIYDSRDIVRQLKKYGENGDIPAILLHIDSPGGAVVPSMEIYEEILKLREETGIVVVASFASVAASGAYLIACGCDTIVSHPGSITGSIGTVLSYPVASGLLDKVGVQYEVIKSGEYKDVGNWARSVTPKERKMLQNLIDDSYRQFADIVSENRGIPLMELIRISQGQIYTGAQAKELGLVDVLGNYYDAVDLTAEMAGIEGEPKTVREIKRRRPSFWDIFTDGLALLRDVTEEHKRTGPQLEYIMK
ncbi:MAG: signal peptide peptidase SppA [candidate division Zixibacteria bacterium]|nr:signal peptide peptidase SppA [candidate division Zixibacteria bacterium]